MEFYWFLNFPHVSVYALQLSWHVYVYACYVHSTGGPLLLEVMGKRRRDVTVLDVKPNTLIESPARAL